MERKREAIEKWKELKEKKRKVGRRTINHRRNTKRKCGKQNLKHRTEKRKENI